MSHPETPISQIHDSGNLLRVFGGGTLTEDFGGGGGGGGANAK